MVLTQLLSPDLYLKFSPEQASLVDCHLQGLILSNPKYKTSIGGLAHGENPDVQILMKILSNEESKAELKDMALDIYKSIFK